MGFWLEFFMDKRFSWDFKIANFVMRDSLRNYLAVDCAGLKDLAKADNCTDHQKKRLNAVIKDMNTLMCKK